MCGNISAALLEGRSQPTPTLQHVDAQRVHVHPEPRRPPLLGQSQMLGLSEAEAAAQGAALLCRGGPDAASSPEPPRVKQKPPTVSRSGAPAAAQLHHAAAISQNTEVHAERSELTTLFGSEPGGVQRGRKNSLRGGRKTRRRRGAQTELVRVEPS